MAKRSRRARKQRRSKPTPQSAQPTPAAEKPQPAEVELPASEAIPGTLVNFAKDYFYVYTELRNVLIVAVLMFVVMFGLAYFV